MDILNAAESYFKSIIDENSFRINACVKDQTQPNAFEELIRVIGDFEKARSSYAVIQNLKSQLVTQQQQEENAS
jgi:tryptophan 2,3-dioxygenase